MEQEYSFIFVIIFLGFVLGSIVWSRSLKHQVGERTRELERAVRERLEFEDALLWESRVNAALADLASALISEPNIDEISNIVLDHAKRLTLSRFGYVGYIDPKTGALISPTLTRDIWANCQIPEKTFVFQKFLGLWGWVLINRKPLMTNSPNQDSRSTGSPEGHLPITKFLSVPALIEEKLVGQIALANSERDYREEDVKMVTRLASFYALALRRWEMEETIKISQKSFHSIVEATDEGIMVAEQNGVIRYVNRAVETLLNRKIEELINRPFRFSPGSESGSSLEIPLQGGEIKTIEIHKVATQWADKPALLITLRDITQRKQMEAAVLKSREMLQSVFDGISDPLVVLDGELKVELLNRAASVYYSIFDKNIIGLHCYHALLNKERCCHNCPINQVFSEKKVVSIERKGLMDPERKEKVVLYPILTAESARCSVIIRISDITDAKFMERQIMQREKLASVGELAAGVAHEINNPINGIINYAQILLDEADQHSETAEIPARIIKEGERIASIVRNLLSFSRQSDDAAAPASVRRIVDDALELMGKQLSNDGIHLYKNIGDDLPQVRVNAQKIQQVFVNLISNARHALNQKYPGLDRDKLLRIDARVEKIGDHAFVRVVFHDHGMGIPARHMGKIFDPFFSTKPRGIGTGLGLTISHEIIKDINGNLTFESEEGKYTDAIVDLPAAE